MSVDLIKTGAAFNRSESKQDYATPWELIHALERRFGKFTIDLAANAENAKAPVWFNIEQDSLAQNWSAISGNQWLNPPFKHIPPWAQKCNAEQCQGAKIFLLTPASVGSNWWDDYVHQKAYVLFPRPRIQFVGATDPYPKDCAISCYFYGMSGYETWRWK